MPSRVTVAPVELEIRTVQLTSNEEMTRQNQELRQQIAGLEEEVAHVKRRAREDRIFLEAKFEEAEELNAAAEEQIVKKEEIFNEKIESLKSRKKGDKARMLMLDFIILKVHWRKIKN